MLPRAPDSKPPRQPSRVGAGAMLGSAGTRVGHARSVAQATGPSTREVAGMPGRVRSKRYGATAPRRYAAQRRQKRSNGLVKDNHAWRSPSSGHVLTPRRFSSPCRQRHRTRDASGERQASALGRLAQDLARTARPGARRAATRTRLSAVRRRRVAARTVVASLSGTAGAARSPTGAAVVWPASAMNSTLAVETPRSTPILGQSSETGRPISGVRC
jgi:hypothetical protein